jgi:hypothetical protein
MTRARRISEGEHPLLLDSEPQVGEPRDLPDRMCRQCEKATEPDTAYGVVISSSGLGHYTADAGTTLCGRDTADMTTT